MAHIQKGKGFIKHDDYMTPKSAWEAIATYIPKDKKIWEAFYGDGDSGKYLQELGFNVIHEEIDFFNDDTLPDYDLIVTNPSFSNVKDIIPRLMSLDKPFILILPTFKLYTNYFREAFKDKKLQLLIPRTRIQFAKLINTKKTTENKCSFDCAYFCYKMDFPKDIIWLP